MEQGCHLQGAQGNGVLLAVGRELGGHVCVLRSSMHCVGAGLQGE